MIATEAYVEARVVARAALPYDNVTSDNGLTAEFLNTESFTFRISTVFRATRSFFMCHN